MLHYSKQIKLLYENIIPQQRNNEFKLKYGSYNFDNQNFNNSNIYKKYNIGLKNLIKNSISSTLTIKYRLKHNYLFCLKQKYKYNNLWKYQQIYNIINSIYKKLYLKRYILYIIHNNLKLWFEDRIIYEYYFYIFFKKYRNNTINHFINLKFINNYFKYKKLILQYYKFLNKIYNKNILELRRLYKKTLKEKKLIRYKSFKFRKKRNRLFPNIILKNQNWKRQRTWKLISNYFIFTKAHLASLVIKNKNNLEYLSDKHFLNYNILLKSFKHLNIYSIYELKKISRIFFKFIEYFYNISIRKLKLIFNKIIKKNPYLNNWYDFFIIFENQIAFFINRFLGIKLNNTNLNIKINKQIINNETIIKISDILEIMNISNYNKYNYLFFKNIGILLFSSMNLLYFKNIIFKNYYNIIKKLYYNNKIKIKKIKYKPIYFFYKLMNILKKNNKYKYLFSINFLNKLYSYKYYNVHDYYFYNHLIMKSTNYKQILLIPFKYIILSKINHKISNYKFFSFFLKKKELYFLKYKSYTSMTKFYRLNYGRIYFFRKPRYRYKLIQKFISFKLRYNQQSIKKFNYANKIKNIILWKKKKNLNLYIQNYPFECFRLSIIFFWINKSINKNKIYNSFGFWLKYHGLKIKLGKKIGIISFIKKINKRKKRFKLRFKKRKFKVFIPDHYIPFKNRIFRKHKFKNAILFKLQLNAIAFNKIFQLLCNQLIDYDRFLIFYTLKNKKLIYNTIMKLKLKSKKIIGKKSIFLIYQIPFTEIVFRINSYLKDKNYFISNLPTLSVFKKYLI
jgi:hypothetical protein